MCIWCRKRWWSPPLCASIALKIGKNGLKVRKLYLPPSEGGWFYKKFSIEKLIAYFQTLQKIYIYYSIALRDRRWIVELMMMISRSIWKIIEKVCSDEIGGVQMNKKRVLQFEKTNFLYSSFLAAPFDLHFKDAL